MSRLAPAIRLRRRELDAIALRLAAGEARLQSLRADAVALVRRRSAERHLAAAAPLACDAFFSESARRLTALGHAEDEAECALSALRAEAVQLRARLQLLEDAASEQRRADERRRLAKADTALGDRIAAAWKRR